MEISHEMSKAQIAEAQRQAREWLSRPAGEGLALLADVAKPH
jgi:hypothetical protein